jgi:hypothetical protein
MARLNDPIIELSIGLQQLPFDFAASRRRNQDGTVRFTVTLCPIFGDPVTGQAPTFALAYTVAINKLNRERLVSYEPSIEDGDYDATIADFEAGRGRR